VVDWIALGIAILSLVVTGISVRIGWLRLRDQREALELAKRQWEESGSRITIEGSWTRHHRDRLEDTIEFRVANSGRLATTVDEIRLGSVPSGDSSIDPENVLPKRLEPGENVVMTVTLDYAVNTVGLILSDYEWNRAYVTVRTGDGMKFTWNPEQGMEPDLVRYV
jgi:hypothetical protein